MSEPRFDITYFGNPMLEPHFCRGWDGETGCYGTNPDHGLSFDEAKAEVISYHRKQIERWESMTYEKYFAANCLPTEKKGRTDNV